MANFSFGVKFQIRELVRYTSNATLSHYSMVFDNGKDRSFSLFVCHIRRH